MNKNPPYLPTSLPPYLPTSLPPYLPTSLPPHLPTNQVLGLERARPWGVQGEKLFTENWSLVTVSPSAYKNFY